MNDNKLKSCPFCGSHKVDEYIATANTLYFICRSCEVRWTRLGDRISTFNYLNFRSNDPTPLGCPFCDCQPIFVESLKEDWYKCPNGHTEMMTMNVWNTRSKDINS